MTPPTLFFYFLAVAGGLAAIGAVSLVLLVCFLLVRGVIVQNRRS